MGAPAAFGRYQLGKRLAIGGMGEVYLATQSGPLGFEKPMALKLLLPHLGQDAQGIEPFLEEGRLVARMNHPNVVQVLDMGQEGGRYFLAMELVEGVSLWRLITRLRERGERASSELLAYVARSLCDALEYAHGLADAAGRPLELVHRDVSPQNVLVSINGEVKLSDFGIAKVRSSLRATLPGVVKGKLEYVAPEALAGEAVDRRADLFGAAVTVYTLATLDSPFHRSSPSATLQAVEREEAPPLSTVRDDLSLEWSAALSRAMSKSPADRFPTARALRDALPKAGDGAKEALGELVRRVCADDLADLGQKASEVVSARTATLNERPTEPVSAPAAAPRTRRTKRALWGVGVGALGLALAVAALWPTVTPSTSLPPQAPSEAPESSASSASGVPVAPRAADPEAAPIPTPTAKAVAVEEAPRRAEKPAAHGSLDVDATPWAVVYINGKRVGETPLAGYPVLAGKVKVVLHNPETQRRVTRSFQVAPGGRVSVRENLR